MIEAWTPHSVLLLSQQICLIDSSVCSAKCLLCANKWDRKAEEAKKQYEKALKSTESGGRVVFVPKWANGSIKHVLLQMSYIYFCQYLFEIEAFATLWMFLLSHLINLMHPC